jgi:hypothetical protein
MVAQHFVVGERVRLRIATPFAQVGKVGTVGRVFTFLPDLYDVQFDGLIGPRLIFGRELERTGPVSRRAAPS